MHPKAALAVVAITLSSFVQFCPAPPVVIAAAITAGGAVIGGAISTAGKRDVEGLGEYSSPAVDDLPDWDETPHVATFDDDDDEDTDVGMIEERAASIPPGVPKVQYRKCVKALKNTRVVVHGPVKNHGIRANNVPPTCMTLATVLVGNPVNGPRPTPCGSACLLYNNLTKKQYNKLRNIFLQHKG